jgi:hypothetical protein
MMTASVAEVVVRGLSVHRLETRSCCADAAALRSPTSQGLTDPAARQRGVVRQHRHHERQRRPRDAVSAAAAQHHAVAGRLAAPPAQCRRHPRLRCRQVVVGAVPPAEARSLGSARHRRWQPRPGSPVSARSRRHRGRAAHRCGTRCRLRRRHRHRHRCTRGECRHRQWSRQQRRNWVPPSVSSSSSRCSGQHTTASRHEDGVDDHRGHSRERSGRLRPPENQPSEPRVLGITRLSTSQVSIMAKDLDAPWNQLTGSKPEPCDNVPIRSRRDRTVHADRVQGDRVKHKNTRRTQDRSGKGSGPGGVECR